jgi:hypothetical protein
MFKKKDKKLVSVKSKDKNKDLLSKEPPYFYDDFGNRVYGSIDEQELRSRAYDSNPYGQWGQP